MFKVVGFKSKKMRAARNVSYMASRKNGTIGYKLRWYELILIGCFFGLAGDGNGECGGLVKLHQIF